MSPAGRFPVHPYRPKLFVCTFPFCNKACRTKGGLKRHSRLHRRHDSCRAPTPDSEHHGSAASDLGGYGSERSGPELADQPNPSRHIRFHPVLDGSPCDPYGEDLLPSVPLLPFEPCAQGDWTPFTRRAQFELAEFLYQKVQMSAGKTDMLMDILASLYDGQDPPFGSHDDLYESIDAIPYGDCPWQSFSVKYSGSLPEDPPSWMLVDYDVWYRDPLSLLEQQFQNPEFADAIDYAAKVSFTEAQ
ncbi:hypothetical protein JVU11DRAFT_3019 [Chiua virens]|nr:hypothetical protein JVU11DRAFT_3019 [Chiua virens]